MDYPTTDTRTEAQRLDFLERQFLGIQESLLRTQLLIADQQALIERLQARSRRQSKSSLNAWRIGHN